MPSQQLVEPLGIGGVGLGLGGNTAKIQVVVKAVSERGQLLIFGTPCQNYLLVPIFPALPVNQPLQRTVVSYPKLTACCGWVKFPR